MNSGLVSAARILGLEEDASLSHPFRAGEIKEVMGPMTSSFIHRTSCLPAIEFATAMRSYWNHRCNCQWLRLAAKPRGERAREPWGAMSVMLCSPAIACARFPLGPNH